MSYKFDRVDRFQRKYYRIQIRLSFRLLGNPIKRRKIYKYTRAQPITKTIDEFSFHNKYVVIASFESERSAPLEPSVLVAKGKKMAEKF